MLTDSTERKYLARMHSALVAAKTVVKQFAPDTFTVRDKGGRDVITEVDRKVSDVLRETLLEQCEGWLSEEDVDDPARLSKDVVWVVDPLDGTREFVDGIPEWCISIGLTIGGVAVAGAICNPATDELFLGSLRTGVTYNGCLRQASLRTSLDGALVLASRQDYIRGEWAPFERNQFSIRPTGSVAYKLALVSVGLADATWSLSPKHEWDIAAGVALVNSGGGYVGCIGGNLQFNRREILLPGFVASARGIVEHVLQVIDAGATK
jgi:myo-inositol-1(or 4)-monophosphatase